MTWEDGKLRILMEEVDQAQWKLTKVVGEELLWNLRTGCCNKCVELRVTWEDGKLGILMDDVDRAQRKLTKCESQYVSTGNNEIRFTVVEIDTKRLPTNQWRFKRKFSKGPGISAEARRGRGRGCVRRKMDEI